jgi:DNA-binding NarL/FixJ family response regulator
MRGRMLLAVIAGGTVLNGLFLDFVPAWRQALFAALALAAYLQGRHWPGRRDWMVLAVAALSAGGFLLKAADPRELILGVRSVAGGAAFLSPRIAQQVIARMGGGLARADRARDRLAGLTAREREVITLVGRGLSNAEIGRSLFLAEGTVKTHVSAVLLRLGLRNRVQAAILAYEAGLV